MKSICICALLVILLGCSEARSATRFYVCDVNGMLGTVDPQSGAVTLIGAMGVQMTDLAFDGNGNLYGLSFDTFYRIDPLTGATGPIGSHGIADGNALAIASDNTIYAAGGKSSFLYTVNPSNGVATAVGDTGKFSSGDLAFAGGSLFMTALTDADDQLVRLNRATAAADVVGIGDLGFQDVYGLATDANGTLYGLTGASLIVINTGNGAAKLDLTYSGLGAAYGAALLPPELVSHEASISAVSNARAMQRTDTQLVDIYYDLTNASGDLQTIALRASSDSGQTFTIPLVTVTGDAGFNVSPGTDKHILWNAGVDWSGQFSATTELKIVTIDQNGPVRASIVDWTGATAVDDGMISASEYGALTNSSGGAIGGFGNVIGSKSKLYFDTSSSGQLNIGIQFGGGTMTPQQDAIVMYIDSVAGGLHDIGTINDVGGGSDRGRAAVSGLGIQSGSSKLSFAPGFYADYAIAIEPTTANLFQINPNGSLTFIKSVNLMPGNNGTDQQREIQLQLSDLSLPSGGTFRWVATLLNANNGYRSNELNGEAAYSGGNIGNNYFVFSSFNTYTTTAITGATTSYFSLSNTFVLDTGTDSDGDGIGDDTELFVTGTDPHNPNSTFRMTAIHQNPDGSVKLSWLGKAGKNYSVQRSSDLAFENYSTIASGVPGVEPVTTFTDSRTGLTSTGPAFYRVAISP